MLTFSVTRDPSLLAEEDIYRFLPLKNLKELLKEEHSLCLVRHPEWCGKPVPLQRIRGELAGKTESVFYKRGQERFQSAVKNALDRNLATPYLFSSWKKSGVRTFKIIQKGHILQEFDDFESALGSLIPGNFIPQFEYERKLPVMGIFLLQEKRAQERRELLHTKFITSSRQWKRFLGMYDGTVVLSDYYSPLYAPLAVAGWDKLEVEVCCSAAGRTAVIFIMVR